MGRILELPHNIEAEQALLCCAIIDNKTIPIIKNELVESDFYSNRNRIIFRHIISIDSEVDILTLKNSITMSGDLAKSGGNSYLISLATTIMTVAGFQSYIDIILECSARRRLIEIGTKLMCNSHNDNLEQLISETKIQINEIISKKSYEITNEIVANRFYNYAHDSTEPGLYTGIAGIEKRFYFENGGTHCIAAESNTGKSALALQIADYVADRYGKTLFFTLESTRNRLFARLVCRNTMIPLSKINKRGGDDGYSEVENIDMQDYLASYKNSNLEINDDSRYIFIENIINHSESYQLKYGLKAIFIDFLQMIDTLKPINSAREKINYIIMRLKELAKRLDVPVIYLSQLRKDIEGRPKVDDLIESNYIRTHTDYIMFLYSPDRDDEKYQYTTELFLAKGKDQERFSVWLYFDGRFQLFTSGNKPEKTSKNNNKNFKIY